MPDYNDASTVEPDFAAAISLSSLSGLNVPTAVVNWPHQIQNLPYISVDGQQNGAVAPIYPPPFNAADVLEHGEAQIQAEMGRPTGAEQLSRSGPGRLRPLSRVCQLLGRRRPTRRMESLFERARPSTGPNARQPTLPSCQCHARPKYVAGYSPRHPLQLLAAVSPRNEWTQSHFVRAGAQ